MHVEIKSRLTTVRCLSRKSPLITDKQTNYAVFVGFFPGGGKNHGKNRPGKNRFWTGFFHLGGKKTPGFWTAKSGKNLEKIGFGQVFSAVLEKIPFFFVQNAKTEIMWTPN